MNLNAKPHTKPQRGVSNAGICFYLAPVVNSHLGHEIRTLVGANGRTTQWILPAMLIRRSGKQLGFGRNKRIISDELQDCVIRTRQRKIGGSFSS